MKEASAFWESVPLEELAEQQRVSAVDDLDEIADLWPADDNPVNLLLYTLVEHAERRNLSKNQRDRNKEI
jgi:hypothetical protein